MKSIHFVILFLFLGLFVACLKSDGLEPKEANPVVSLRSENMNTLKCLDVQINDISNSVATTVNVGALHNDLLAFQRAYIANNPIIPSGISSEDYFSNIYSSFMTNNGIDVMFELRSFEDRASFDVFDHETFLLSISDNSEDFQSLVNSLLNSLTAFVDVQNSEQSFINQMESIRANANLIANPGEKAILISVVEIALSSLEYWKVNITSYENEMNTFIGNNFNKFYLTSEEGEIISARTNKVDVKEMLEWDIAGALKGADVGFVAAGGPAGAVAVGLAADAGASAVNLIWQSFWD